MNSNILKIVAAGSIIFFGIMPWAHADVYINVVAVNGADSPKTSTIHFDLPGDLTADDILDTNGLQLDYNVDDANYFVYGDVTLNGKESKTFKIHVKDKWSVTPDQISDLKNQIEQGYETLGVPHNAQNAEILKKRLDSQIDYIVNLQSTNTDSIDKRIDAYRAYAKEMKRIQNNALNVDYWRSDPGVDQAPKLVHMTIEAKNPTQKVQHYKYKNYLPAEVKPEDVVEAQDFEVRYDQAKQLAFLFKEEDIAPGETKKYTIGIQDIWTIDQVKIDYLRSRTKYAYDFLKDSKFEESAKFLSDRINANLDTLEASQAVQRPVMEHISSFRANKSLYNDTENDVETLEKLLAVYREDLEKSKVENVLQKIQSLKNVSDISKVLFSKKFEQSTAWGYIGWVLLFVGLITLINFVVWLLRSKDKKIKEETSEKK